MGLAVSATPSAATQRLSRLRLAAATAGIVGQSLGWAVQIGYTSRTLLQLHLEPRYMSLAWLCGPISGLLMQPVVGVLSDRCTARMGRRRPFLIGGTVATVVALWSFAYARAIGSFIGVAPLVVAIAAFWVLDFAMNASTFFPCFALYRLCMFCGVSYRYLRRSYPLFVCLCVILQRSTRAPTSVDCGHHSA
jgi:solute carrier family 45, member 1/2/4